MNILFYIASLLLGLVFGSFLNVVIWRVPRGESIVSPPSHCPACGKNILPYDNIPVLSYLILRGKCRKCKTEISAQYPLIEAVTGIFFILCAVNRGASLLFLRDVIFLSSMLVVTVVDLKHWIILDEISIGGFFAGIAFSFAPGGIGVVRSAAAGIGAFLLFLIFRLGSSFYLSRKGDQYVKAPTGFEDEQDEFQGGMGWGDVKLAACIGAFLGPGSAAVAFFLSFLTGAIAGILMILLKGRDKRVPLPFGPFLAIGSGISLFFGNAIWNAYLNFGGFA